jgi:hypothetical protein
MSDNDFKIMCFSWNTAGLKICETANQRVAKEERSGFLGMVGIKKQCIPADFFSEIRKKVDEVNPKVVIITTLDEDDSKTYFHSDYLKKSMEDLQYSLLKRDKIDNVGEPGSKNPYTDLKDVNLDNPIKTAMRVSIFVINSIINQVEMDEAQIPPFYKNNKGQKEMITKQGGRAIGTIASYIKYNDKTFLFIITHIPAGQKILKVDNAIKYEKYRDITVAGNKLAFHDIFDKLIDPIDEKYKPNTIFILGDLNYDIKDTNPLEVIKKLSVDAPNYKDYYDKDELKNEISMSGSALYGFEEGLNNEGPKFLPTWDLKRNRPENCQTLITTDDGKKVDDTCFNLNSLSVGWHDRIIYKNYNDNLKVNCEFYKRLDYKNMNKSTHAGIMGIYNLSK